MVSYMLYVGHNEIARCGISQVGACGICVSIGNSRFVSSLLESASPGASPCSEVLTGNSPSMARNVPVGEDEQQNPQKIAYDRQRMMGPSSENTAGLSLGECAAFA